MRTLVFFSLLSVALFSENIHAQQDKPTFGIAFSGFIKTDVFYDSRQTVSLREGHFHLYPANEFLDSNNADVNAAPNFNILSLQTRLVGKISAPDAFGAKTSGIIEGEFFGTSDADANGFRLRHAYTKLDWENTSLLIGQTWHPMFVMEVFPGVVSFNTGAPFQPFSRNPQIRLTHTINDLKLILVAATQRDFQSFGPGPSNTSVQSTSFLRNSALPNLHFQLQYKSSENIFGAGIDYKKLKPRLATDKNIKTDEQISSVSALGYAKLDISPFILKFEGVYGSNLSDMLMLGGYAAEKIDPPTGVEKYIPIKCMSAWGEIIYGKELEFALFAGYTQNLGASNNLTGTYYSRGGNIDYIYRIAPRAQWNSGRMRLASEVEYTAAAYGFANNSNKGLVGRTKLIENLRILCAAYIFF